MNSDQLSVQREVEASCIECGTIQQFRMNSGDGEAATAHFGCTACGHTITIDLAP